VRTIRFCSVVFGITSSLAVTRFMSTVTVYCVRPCLVGRIDRAWSSYTRRKQNAGCKVQNTNYGAPVIDCNADNRWFWAFSLPHLHSMPQLEGFPSEYCHAVWYRKTKMVWLAAVKIFWRYVYSFWHNARTWRTHTYCMTAMAALAYHRTAIKLAAPSRLHPVSWSS